MKQGEVITTKIGSGVAYLRECNNGLYENKKSPDLTLINPSAEWVEDGVYCVRPAISISVLDPKALYDFLHEYFNS